MSFDPVGVRTRVIETGWEVVWRTRARLFPQRFSRAISVDPYLWVSPHDVVYKTARAFRVRRMHGAILDGDWDVLSHRFEDLDVYRAIRARFVDGVPWAETEFYHRVLRNIADGQVKWRCRTRADFDRRCRRLDSLYDELRREGMKINRAEPSRDISVNVGRQGDLLFNEGRHRLSMSKLLDLPSIPVRIVVQHGHWARLDPSDRVLRLPGRPGRAEAGRPSASRVRERASAGSRAR